MTTKHIIRAVAFVELLIGLSTIFSLTTLTLLSISTKPLNVFIFVTISATISAALGIGIFKYKENARSLLVFFSGYVVLTKILIFSNLMHLCCDIVTFVSPDFKNSISIAYHLLIIFFFTRNNVKKFFIKQ